MWQDERARRYSARAFRRVAVHELFFKEAARIGSGAEQDVEDKTSGQEDATEGSIRHF